MLHYFMAYASPTLQPMLKIGLYLTFTIRMLLAFGIAFQIPFLMVMATRTGLLRADHVLIAEEIGTSIHFSYLWETQTTVPFSRTKNALATMLPRR